MYVHVCRREVTVFSITAPESPNNVTVSRINETAMRVTWTPLSIVQARGHLIGYVVSYSLESRKRQTSPNTKMVGPEESSTVISDLRRGRAYIVTVSAFNGQGGRGEDSESVILDRGSTGKGILLECPPLRHVHVHVC